MQLVGYKKMRLSGRGRIVTLKTPGMLLDLGGAAALIVEGITADRREFKSSR